VSLTRTTLLVTMASLVQDDAGKITHTDPGDFGTAIDAAVERYSKDRPREIVATASGDGSAFDFALPSGWVDGFSALRRVEYPFPPASGQREPNVIYDADEPNEPAAVRIVQATSAAKKLRFMEDTPAAGSDNVLIVYTGLHTIHASTSSSTTVPTSDELAVAYLASAYACQTLAAKYTEASDAALSADTVDWRSKGREFSDRGAELLQKYLELVGADPNASVPPAYGTAEWDLDLVNGRDRLTHPARGR